jgi:GNAT superfamily N-acetyltransferase
MKFSSSTPAGLYKPESLSEYEIIIKHVPEYEMPIEIVDQIIIKSRQRAMLESVPKDASKRFSDIESYIAWAEKGKLLFCLLKDDDLSGLIWFSESKNEITPEAESTFAIRLYEGYSGKGLARPFMALSHFLLPRLIDVSGNTWLETDNDNFAAQKLYSGFGYIPAGVSAEGRTVMEYHSINE